MADCFISYASVDGELAYFVGDQLEARGLSVFMASASLKPGQNWTDEIWRHLRSSRWVVFLASRAACASPYVQQELTREGREFAIEHDLDQE